MAHVYLEDVLRIAAAEVGYREKNSNANLDSKTAANDGSGNYTKYARDLAAAGYYNGNKNGYAWCDVFVDWCIYMASGKDAAYAQKVECQSGPLGAGCPYSYGYYKSAGRLFGKPQAGDQVFFAGCNHTGLVERVDGQYIYTIEGNSNNRVERKQYAINGSGIEGYGRPKYDEMPQDIGKGNEYSKEARAWAVRNGIVEGVGKNKDGTTNFAWDHAVTREQLVTILYRMEQDKS